MIQHRMAIRRQADIHLVILEIYRMPRSMMIQLSVFLYDRDC